MTVLGRIGLGTVALALALSAAVAAPGADHEVQQVRGPYVVRHEVGPLMEVSRTKKRQASGCLSCTLHGLDSSNYGGGYSSSSYGMDGEGVSPQSSSSRQEFRSQQQFVNGQPVYKLHHERHFQDGRLVHDRRLEEDEDDLGYSADSSSGYHGSQSSLTRSGSTNSGYGQDSYYSRPNYSNTRGSHLSGQNHGSDYGYTSSHSQAQSSTNFQGELTRMREDLRRQMLSGSSQQPTYGGSQRTEHNSETRYINGKPVYTKKNELSYKDGQLVNNRTQEQGPDDLGTEDIVRRYDSNGDLITGGSGHYERNQEHQQQFSSSSRNAYPGYSSSSNYPSYQSWESWSSYSSSPVYGHHSSYRPSSGGSSTRHRDESSWSSSRYPSYRPTSGSSSTTYREESGQDSSSYPTYRPTSGGSSTIYREDSSQHSSSYPPHRPTSGSSSTAYRGESGQHSSSYPRYRQTPGSSSTIYREESSQHSSSYPSSQPISGSSSTTYRGESNLHSSSYPSYRPASGSSSTSYREDISQPTSSSYPDAPDDLDEMPVRHNEGTPSDNHPNTRTYPQNSGSFYSGESQEGHRHRHSGGHRGNSHRDTSKEEHFRQYEHRRAEETGSSFYQPSVGTSSGGARTVAFDLSSPTSTSGSSITDHLLQPNHSGRRHDTSDEDLQQHSDNDYEQQQQTVGIPGVLSGPPASTGQPKDGDSDDDDDDDDDRDGDKQRYDISPLDDGVTPTLPSVDNELESGPIIPIPSSDRINTGSTETNVYESSDHLNTHPTQHRRPFSSGSFSTTYHYGNTYNQRDDRVTGHVSPSDRDQHYSQTLSHDESRNTRPVVGSSSYHYNETNTRTSMAGGHQQQTLPGQLPSTPCSQAGGCVTSGMPQSISRRTEIRTTRRYVNGHLVGITTHERQFENGTLVHENSTEYGRDEVEGLDLGDIGDVEMDLTQGTYHPDSYSQRHEVKSEKKFVNGQQVYEVNQERRFEDGSLVYDNRTEKDEDDFHNEGHGSINLGLTPRSGDTRQQVTQTQHHHRQATSGRGVSGGRTRSSQDHRVTDTTRVAAIPTTYTSRRYENRHEQEFVDGQPVYDLRHERHYHDGSLVHENRTELTEEELARGGYRDALLESLASDTLNTATQFSHSGSDRQNYGSYGGAVESSQRNSHSRGSHIQGSGSYDQSRESYGRSHGSYGRDSGSHDQSSSETGSFTTSILTSGRRDSGRAATTVLGGTGSLLTGSDSLRSSSSSDEDNSREFTSLHQSHSTSFQGQESRGTDFYDQRPASSSRNVGSVRSESRVMQSSSSSSTGQDNYGASGSFSGPFLSPGSHGSGRTTTTVLGGSSGSRLTGSDSSRGTASHYGGGSHGTASSYESHSSTSQTRQSGGSGCLSCVLLGGAGHTQDSHEFSRSGLSGTGHSHRSETQASRTTQGGGGSSRYSSSRSGRVGSEVCQPNPCRNGGTCLPGIYSAICTCHFGFSGRMCEEVECPRGYCRRGGTCTVEGGRHVCTCTSGYEGPRCQHKSPRRTRRYASKP